MLIDESLDLVNVEVSVTDSGEEGIYRRVFLLLHELRHHVVRELQLPVLQTSAQQFLALCGNLVLRLAQSLADLVSCLGGNHIIHPVGRRLLVLSAHDLHHVSGLEFLLDGDSLPIDLASDALQSEIGVDIESEIKH